MQSLIQSVKSWFSGPDALTRLVADIYIDAVNQAREAHWYEGAQVPDTLDGRFEVIILQLFLLMQALKHTTLAPDARQLFEQRLLEHFVADMDRNLREVGVSDTGMHRRMKHVAEALFGRLKAYGAAWENAETKLPALLKNLYGEKALDVPAAAQQALLSQAQNSEQLWQHKAPALMQQIASASLQ